MEEQRNLSRLKVFLRVYGVISVVLFPVLILGFYTDFAPLDYGGPLNWTIWNGLQCGDQQCHVPPMLFSIYIVWGVFFLLVSARDPRDYSSFLQFTMWANFIHGAVMVQQAATHFHHYWSKFFTDIPFVWILALGIFLWGPKAAGGIESWRQRR